MKQTSQQWIASASLVLVFPSLYFIFISVLKYSLHIDGPYDNSWPFLVQLGIKESIGININLLILFGPILTILINLMQVLTVDKRFTRDHFHFHVRIRKKWLPLAVVLFSGLLLGVLALYLFTENCTIN